MGNVNSLGPSIDPNQIYQNDLNIDNDLQTTKTTVNNNSTAISAQQAQLNTTQTTANSASTAITTHIAQATGAHAASAISETRLGDAQTALNDVNTRVTNIVGQTGSSNTEIVDARQSTPENNTFTVLKDRLDSSDNIQAIIDQARADIMREAINSGVYRFSTITAGNTATPNAFAIAQEEANVNGQRLNLGTPTIQLSAPPSANVTPALPGSARDDLIFLEMWKQWVAPGGTLYANGNVNGTTSVATYGQYQWQWREREVDGVDFATYPEGLSASNVFAQGARGTVGTVVFAKSTTDTGLYTASDATGAPIDGLVYAIPLFRVRRRNTTAYDPDSNLMGGATYYPNVGSVQFTTTSNNTGTLANFGGGTSINSIQVGMWLNNGGNLWWQITGVNTATSTITVNGALPSFTGTWLEVTSRSDRPDGLYSNIVDATDIVDLRHQVSLTGFNNQALLEKNLDLLLRGQLNTVDTPRYTRNYWLNTTGYTDDVNTLLFCNFDGNDTATANGATVTVTGSSHNYVNGVQGLAANFFGGHPTYTLATPISTSTAFTFEGLIKPGIGISGTNHILYAGGLSLYFTLMSSGSLQLNASLVFASGSQYPNVSLGTSPGNDWLYYKFSFDPASGDTVIQLADKVYQTQYLSTLAQSITTVQPNGDSGLCYQDLLRISNIVRTGTPLPTGFSYANGDRILDGAMADFNYWSDDVGGITGVNGRTNPYGLTHVPNQVHAKVAYNGAEVREYFGTGITPGWSSDNGAGNNPVGSFDNSVEHFANVNSNETADGIRTTFTFNAPPNALGMLVFWGSGGINLQNNLYVGGTGISGAQISSASLSNGVLTVALTTAPTNSTSVQFIWRTAQRHAHFIPSTKGFLLHDWTDDTYSSVNGTQTAFQTTKYNVTSLNHVRVTPSASTVATIQNGGYTTQGLNCATSLTASAASTVTTLTVGSSANMFAGQNIRITKGDGTWYTTTVTSITNSTTIVVPALTVGLTSGATIQGVAQVTFVTAPASASNVDVVYESVITPSLGDYLRIAYQHTPYQGTIGKDVSVTAILTVLKTYKNMMVTTVGTGLVVGGTGGQVEPLFAYGIYQLPLATATAMATLKRDSISIFGKATGATSVRSPILGSFSSSADIVKEGTQFSFSGTGYAIEYQGAYTGYLNAPDLRRDTVAQPIDTAVPHASIFPYLVVAPNGEILLCVESAVSSDTNVLTSAWATLGAMDVFHLQGRPLIKGYSGVTA